MDQALLALTGLWYWGPRPYVLRLRADRAVELSPAAASGRASRFRAETDGTWTGLDGYYAGDGLKRGKGMSVKTNSAVLAQGLAGQHGEGALAAFFLG